MVKWTRVVNSLTRKGPALILSNFLSHELDMNPKTYKSSWAAFLLFYVVLLGITLTLDMINNVLSVRYFGTQAVLITVGVAIFAAVGIKMPNLSALHGVFLAFTVGILTIIPAVLMGLGRVPNLWPQYFYIAFGMAAGSFLTFLFMLFSKKFKEKEKSE